MIPQNNCHTNDQSLSCPMFDPNNCEVGNVSYNEKEKCEALEKVKCEYYHIGCAEHIAHEDLKQHNEKHSYNHQSLTNKELFKLQDEIETSISRVKRNTNEELDEIEDEFNSVQKQLDCLFGIWSVRIMSW